MNLSKWCLTSLLLVFAGSVSAEPSPVRLFSASAPLQPTMTLSPQAIHALQAPAGEVVLDNVPTLTGITSSYHLQPVEVFADDATITYTDGVTSRSEPLDSDIRVWTGKGVNDPSKTIFLSIDEEQSLHALVLDGNSSATAIVPAANGGYRVVESLLPDKPFCEVLHRPGTDPAGDEPEIAADPTDTLYEAEFTIDIGNQLRVQLANSNVTPTRYVADLFGALNAIYRRDLGAVLKVTNLVVWNPTDPFNSNLATYRTWVIANRNATSYDLCHLLDFNPGEGGEAYYDVLDSLNDFRVGVSNVNGTGQFPPSISTYYWDINVTAHEIGHNFGSLHTHCYSPPIDCCNTQCPVQCPVEQPTVGTIMSYCHLLAATGGSIVLNFHPRVINTIRPKIEDSPLLTALPRRPEVGLTGRANAIIYPGDNTPSAVDGTQFPTSEPGGAPRVVSFTVTNIGNELLTFSSPAFQLTGSAAFNAVWQTPTTQLAPGASANILVTFTPTSLGNHTAQLSINTNDPQVPNFVISLAGRVAEKGLPQTFDDPPNGVVIPDNSQQGTWSDIAVAGVNGSLMDIRFRLNGDNCANEWFTGIQHGRVSDLRVTLTSPAGTVVTILNNPGSGAGGAHFCQTVFADNPAYPLIDNITAGGAPYSGNYRPYLPLNTFIGENPNGTWRVRIYDTVAGVSGNFWSASLILTGESASAVGEWSLY